MKRHLCLILMEICTLCGYAQQDSYNGIVSQAKSKQPIEFVTVCLLAQDSTVVDFVYTDEKGRFELTRQPQKGKLLSFSCIGYKRKIVPLSEFANNSLIMLEEQVFKIQEVKISSNRISQRKDTLIYSVSGFKMPQDRSIEDVLKKIPGIEVTANGQIKFQDRPISNFYIEGMNLLGSKYALASKNIPANIVKEIQVLQSHQSIEALRGKSFSERAALNLTLADDAKSRLIGTVDIGIGMNESGDAVWDNRLTGMLFGKKMQNLTMYKGNNTGNDIANEITPLTLSSLQSTSNPDIFSSGISIPRGIDRSRYLSNDAHLVAVNHLYKPQKEKDLRLQITALHDELSAGNETETTYFYPTQTLVISEDEKYRGIKNRLEAEFAFTRNGSNVYIKNIVRGTASLHKSELAMTSNTVSPHVHNHPQRKILQNNFQLIKNYKRYSLSVYSNNSYTELPQYMSVSPGYYEELLNDGQPYECMRQEALLRAFKSDIYTYFQHKVGGMYLKYRAGVIYENRYLQSKLYTDEHPLANTDYANNVRLENIEAYIEPSLNLKTTYGELQFRLPLTYHHSLLRNKLPQTERHSKHCLLPTPSLNWKYNLNAYWNINNTSTLTFIKPDINRLYAGYLFKTYRTAQSYDQTLTYDKNVHSSLRLNYSNPLNGFFVSFNGFFNQTWQENIYVYENRESILSLSQSYRLPNTKRSYGGGARASKAVGWCKLFAALSASYNRINDNIILENNLVDSHLSYVALAADLSLQPLRYINLTANSKAVYYQSQVDWNDQAATRIWSYEHSLDFNLIFSKAWKARIKNYLTHDNRNKRVTYFADASITYSRKKWLFEVEMHNLLNHNILERTSISSWIQETSIYTLREREMLLKTSFSF